MKAERTYKELQEFDNAATAYLVANGYYDKDNRRFTDKEPTKLVSNMRNVIKQCSKHFEEFEECMEELRIDHCSVDEKSKVILRELDKTYKYTKEKLKELNTAAKNLRNEKVVIHERMTVLEKDQKWDLSEEEIRCFGGLIIPKEAESEEEAKKE